MITFKKLLEESRNRSNILERFFYSNNEVVIDKSLKVYINGSHKLNLKTLGESHILTKEYIELLATESTNTDKQKLVSKLIEKFGLDKVSQSLVESYEKKLKSSDFSVDKIIIEMREMNSFGKYEYVLKDGSRISISEETQSTLNNILNDKYDIVEYMCASLGNFKEVLGEIRG